MINRTRSISMAARLALTGALAALAICSARAADAQTPEKKRPDSLDVTMTLLPEHAKGPEEITRRIELPRPSQTGERKDGQAEGAGGANKDDKGPPADPGEQGRANADQARERGREFGQEVAEQARENRENAGHGNSGNNGNGGGKGPPAAPPGHP
jgi:hypothetical protein